MRIHDLKMRNMAHGLSLSVFVAFKGTNFYISISSVNVKLLILTDVLNIMFKNGTANLNVLP